MIPKQGRLVITFYTTTDAMAMEHLCREQSGLRVGLECTARL